MAGPSKRAVLEKMLDQGMVMVHLDARREGVRVPSVHRRDPQLRLNLSYRFASRDLVVDDQRVGCTLSFGGRPFYCEIPLSAVFAVTSHVTGEALVWPEALAIALDDATALVAPDASGPKSVPSTDESLGGTEEEVELTPAPAAVQRGHLRLVK